MQKTRNDTLKNITKNVLSSIDPSNPPSPKEIEEKILEDTMSAFELENAVRPKGAKWQIPHTLHASQIADILAHLYPVCRIATSGDNADADYDLLAMYMSDGPDRGIYVTDDNYFRTLAREYNYTLSKRDFEEMLTALRDIVPRRKRNTDKDLIAVNNGIFDYRSKILMPFDPETIFLTKSKVDYVQNPVNPIIHNEEDGTDWDVDTWMHELSDDNEIVILLWQILGAIIRPHVPWGKSAWFYSEKGNNGKGTLCHLMRNLCGDGSYASIPMSDFNKDFLLEPLTRASAVIVDENNVGEFIDKSANLKAVVTNDTIQINRKFKMPIPYKFHGFMVQCLNEYPRVKDKSDSFYRRCLFIPFTKCFTGVEKKYIKQDYLNRPEVLEYILNKVLNTNYYELSEPEAVKLALDQYKEFNDPVRQFIEEILPECQWDLLPFTFLYDLYKAWFAENSPRGAVQSKNTFTNDLLQILPPGWSDNSKTPIKPSNRMDAYEPLIIQYDLKNWMNKNYTGRDLSKITAFTKASSYRGIMKL